jgi:hypothetical protein
VKKDVTVSDEELKKFIADSAQLNIAKIKFDEGKNTLYKGQKFDDVKEKIARSILAENKTDEIQKKVTKMADDVLGIASKNASLADAKLDVLLKPYGLTVKTSGWLTRKSPYLPGFGESKELMSEAFAASGPLDLKKGGHPKKFQSANRFLVAWVSESETADVAKLESERQALTQQIAQRKSMELYQAWLKKLTDKAKVDPNPSVLRSEG